MPSRKLTGEQVFSEIRAFCLAKDGAVEEYPWGDVVWKIKGKLFAGSRENSASVTVKATPAEQAVLIQHPAIKVADYVGRFGWVTIDIADEATLALAKQLIDESYIAVGPKRKRQPARVAE